MSTVQHVYQYIVHVSVIVHVISSILLTCTIFDKIQ